MQFTNPARAVAAALGLGLTLATAACGGAAVPERATTVGSTTANHAEPVRNASTAASRTTVILISVDGLNPSAITVLNRSGRVPTLRRLIAEGTYTMNARTAYEQTNTLPNHTSQLTGLPIAGKSGHHVTFNTSRGGTLASLNGRYVPGIFDRVHDAGLSTMLLAEKSKFAFLVRSWRAKLDVTRIAGASTLTKVLLDRLATDPPNLAFLHIAAADSAGHGDDRYGFMGPRYLDAVARVDRQLGRIVAAIEASKALRARTTLVLTADHGGRGTDRQKGLGHRNPKVFANYRIPFLAWGPGIAARADLYAVNGAARRNPGTSRPSYVGTQPVRNLDAADLVLSLLGLKPLPGTLPGGRAVLRVR